MHKIDNVFFLCISEKALVIIQNFDLYNLKAQVILSVATNPLGNNLKIEPYP
jgi:hypothetical protein